MNKNKDWISEILEEASLKSDSSSFLAFLPTWENEYKAYLDFSVLELQDNSSSVL